MLLALILDSQGAVRSPMNLNPNINFVRDSSANIGFERPDICS